MYENVKNKLLELRDSEYRDFSKKLLPGTTNIIGVRIPDIRRIAKEIANDDVDNYLKSASDETFEEIMLQGMVIGYAKKNLENALNMINNFIPKIDNWSVCDCFCTGLRIAKKYPNEIWNFIIPFLRDDRTFYVRFGVVMILKYYVDKEHIEKAFKEFDNIKNKDYYAQMAVAWAVSCYFIKFKNETMQYLKNNNLDDFTFNKSIQKIIESYRVDKNIKNKIKKLKRN